MRRLILPFLALVGCCFLTGCGPKDVDPNAPVDAPGYYNGPMQPRGGGAGGAGGGADAKTAPEEAKTAPEGAAGS